MQIISQIYFLNKILHVSDSSSVHHQEFFTLHTAMHFRPDPARKLSANLYDIHHCCVYSEKLLMMDTGTVRNIEFYSKNKFEKLMRIVGCIIRIYHDVRSPERQIQCSSRDNKHCYVLITIYYSFLSTV